MDFTPSVAGVLYIGVGWLQEAFGLASAKVSRYLLRVPAALLTLYVLTRNRASLTDS